jgi:uncharacterized protein YjiK
MIPTLPSFLLAVASLGAMNPAQAQKASLAASLGDYGPGLKSATVAGLSVKSFSGVAFHPETGNLYVVDNDNATVYELSVTGLLLRAVSTTGFADPEGISYQGGDYFLIAEEGPANIVRVALPRTGSGPVARAGAVSLNLGPDMANFGIEGVSYRHADQTAYAVKEISPSRLYRITCDSGGIPKAVAPDQPFSLGALDGDAADVWALDDGNFILVNQEQNRLVGFDSTGKVLSSLALGMSKPEGIAIDTRDGTIYIVGEPMELTVWKPQSTRIGKGPRPALHGREPGIFFSLDGKRVAEFGFKTR